MATLPSSAVTIILSSDTLPCGLKFITVLSCVYCPVVSHSSFMAELSPHQENFAFSASCVYLCQWGFPQPDCCRWPGMVLASWLCVQHCFLTGSILLLSLILNLPILPGEFMLLLVAEEFLESAHNDPHTVYILCHSGLCDVKKQLSWVCWVKFQTGSQYLFKECKGWNQTHPFPCIIWHFSVIHSLRIRQWFCAWIGGTEGFRCPRFPIF